MTGIEKGNLEARQWDRLCAACGYNLRGLPKGRACPECGTDPAADYHDELERSDAGWVRRLMWGTLMILAGFGMDGVGILVSLELREDAVAGLALEIAADFMVALGVWVATSPEPGMHFQKRRLEWALRLLAVLALATKVASVAMLMVAPDLSWMYQPLEWAGMILPAALVMTLGYFLQWIARRVPDDALSNWIVMTAFGFVASFVMLVWSARLGLCCVIVPIGLVLAIYPLGMWLLGRLALDLRACAIEAKRRNSAPTKAEGT